jgi:hypothetical protein
MDVVDELCAARNDLAKVDAALSEPKDASRGTENAIDAGLWEDSENLISYLAICISLSLCLSVSLSLCLSVSLSLCLYSLYS